MKETIKSREPSACVNVSDLKKTKNMKYSDTFIVTDADLMRGFDYRCRDFNGIALLIARGLSNNRTRRQALGRVGRYGEKSSRYALKSLKDNLVDINLHDKLQSSIIETCA